jgi:hypothetical protein
MKTKIKTNAAKTIKIMIESMISGIADEFFGKGLGLVEEAGIDVGVGGGGDKEVSDGVFVAGVGDVMGVGVGEEVGEIDEFGLISVEGEGVGFGVAAGCAISRFNV